MLRLALRNVFRNPRRSLLTLIAIAMGLLSSNLLSSLARGLSSQLIDDAIFTLTGHIQIHAPGYLSDPVVAHRFEVSSRLHDFLSTNEDVQTWSMRVRIPAVIMSERESQGVTLVGIDPVAEQGLSFITEAVGQGRFINTPEDKGLIIGRRLAEQLRTDLGKRVVVIGQDADGGVADRGFRVVGLYETELAAKEKAFIFVGRQVAQEMLGMGESISEVSVRARSRERLQQVLAGISSEAPGLDVQSWRTLEPLVTALLKVQSGFLYIWFGIVIVTISFGLVNTIFMSIYERARELGLYQALGMTPAQIRFHVLVESTVLLLIGALAGNLATVLVLSLLHNGIDLSAFAKGTEMFGARSVVHPDWLLTDSLVVNVATIFVGVAASLYPAWRASKIEPAVALGR